MWFDARAALAEIRSEGSPRAIRATRAIQPVGPDLRIEGGGRAIRATRAIPEVPCRTNSTCRTGAASAPSLPTAPAEDTSGPDTIAARPKAEPSDADTLLAHLRAHGPMSYGAAASSLGWGATRAWQAGDALRRSGRVRPDLFGRMAIVERSR